MGELTHIRLSGHAGAFPATREAEAALQRYLDRARTELRSDPDRHDIIRDLESAIGDHLDAEWAAQRAPLTASRMTALLSMLGPVESTRPSATFAGTAVRGRFWCRITRGKWFGGICLGVAAYGEFRVDWVRAVVLLLTLLSGGLLAVVYLILLLVLPVVPSVEECAQLRDQAPPPRGTPARS